MSGYRRALSRLKVITLSGVPYETRSAIGLATVQNPSPCVVPHLPLASSRCAATGRLTLEATAAQRSTSHALTYRLHCSTLAASCGRTRLHSAHESAALAVMVADDRCSGRTRRFGNWSCGGFSLARSARSFATTGTPASVRTAPHLTSDACAAPAAQLRVRVSHARMHACTLT